MNKKLIKLWNLWKIDFVRIVWRLSDFGCNNSVYCNQTNRNLICIHLFSIGEIFHKMSWVDVRSLCASIIFSSLELTSLNSEFLPLIKRQWFSFHKVQWLFMQFIFWKIFLGRFTVLYNKWQGFRNIIPE